MKEFVEKLQDKDGPLDLIYAEYPKWTILDTKRVKVQKGDQYSWGNSSKPSWTKTALDGGYSGSNYVYRRKIRNY